jgi:hypothetical protein
MSSFYLELVKFDTLVEGTHRTFGFFPPIKTGQSTNDANCPGGYPVSTDVNQFDLNSLHYTIEGTLDYDSWV